MKWISILLCILLTGCAVRVTVEPYPKKKVYTRSVKHGKSKHKPKPHPTPKPSPSPNPFTSPYPPDPRIEDIIRTLKDDR